MSRNFSIIDLTDDGNEEESNSTPSSQSLEKRRQLPPSLTAYRAPTTMTTAMTTTTSAPSYQSSYQSPYTSYSTPRTLNAQAPGSYYENLQNRSLYEAMYNKDEAIRSFRVSFSLVDSRDFTARAEHGPVPEQVISTMKQCPGVRFDYNLRRWQFPLGSHEWLFKNLRQLGCIVEPIPRGIIGAATVQSQGRDKVSEEKVNAELRQHGMPDPIINALAVFQREAVQFIISKQGRALVADEMGLGKTRTAIGAAFAYKADWPVLVVCPSSARHHWQAELLNVAPPEYLDPRCVTVVDSQQHPLRSPSKEYEYQFVIISYALAALMHEQLARIEFNVVIADESHYLKTRQSKRTQRIVPLLHRARRAVLLSGTPALSRPLELFTQLNALHPRQWDDLKAFGKRYCRDAKPAKRSAQWGDNYKGANNTQELHVILSATVMIRRLKKDLLQQLPPKKRFRVKIQIEDAATENRFVRMLEELKQYEELLAKRKSFQRKRQQSQRAEETLVYKEDGDVDRARSEKKNLLMDLFTQSGEAKLPAILKYVDKFLKEDKTNKILIFGHHKKVLDGLAAFLARSQVQYIKIDGGTSSKERHGLTQRFQNDPDVRVGVLAITAAGVALTLTAANMVCFAEMFWTPGSLLQAEDRAHRIGQVRPVKILYFFAENSVDELLWPLVRKKMKLCGELVEGHSKADINAALFKESGASKKSASKKKSPETESAESAESGVSTKSTEIVEVDSESDSDIIEDVEDFQDMANELAKEEAFAEVVADSRSSKKRKIQEKSAEDAEGESDDEEGAEHDNEYEEYLNSAQPADALALEYLRQYEVYMQQIQAQEQALKQQQTPPSNEVIDMSQDASDTARPTHLPTSQQNSDLPICIIDDSDVDEAIATLDVDFSLDDFPSTNDNDAQDPQSNITGWFV